MKTVFLVPMGFAAAVVAFGVSAQQAPQGAQLFKQRCAVCHSVAATGGSAVGPNLKGVVGRKAGTMTYNYSPALKNSKITWSRDSLGKYLAAPTKFIPGTKMVIAVPDAGQRAAIIDYLASQK